MMLFVLGAFASDPQLESLMQNSQLSSEPWSELTELCDDIGPRLSGSKNLDRAIRWARQRMREDGLQVELQPVTVADWTRGAESAALLAPVEEPLQILGLGMTVPTPPEGISGRVVVARDFEELEALGKNVAGKIVLYDAPWAGYGNTVEYRISGPDRAAALGAKAVLIRSVTDRALSTPHTGTLWYGEGEKIPAAALTPEAADRMRRWWDRGRPMTVSLNLQSSRSDAGVSSANVIGDVVGTDPTQVVLLSCHLDSWDVGTGAQDDGAACVAVMEAVAQIAALNVQPKRTIRAVLFTNEENGLAGGKQYALANAHLQHIAVIESDTGMGGTLGFRVGSGLDDEDAAKALANRWLEPVKKLLEPLAPLGIDAAEVGFVGSDISPILAAQGGLGLGVKHDMSNYWAIHHTNADTLDKIDPLDLQKETAMLAVVAWQLANAAVPIGENK